MSNNILYAAVGRTNDRVIMCERSFISNTQDGLNRKFVDHVRQVVTDSASNIRRAFGSKDLGIYTVATGATELHFYTDNYFRIFVIITKKTMYTIKDAQDFLAVVQKKFYKKIGAKQLSTADTISIRVKGWELLSDIVSIYNQNDPHHSTSTYAAAAAATTSTTSLAAGSATMQTGGELGLKKKIVEVCKELLDTDGDGRVSLDEFKEGTVEGVEVLLGEEKMAEFFDTNGDGDVLFSEMQEVVLETAGEAVGAVADGTVEVVGAVAEGTGEAVGAVVEGAGEAVGAVAEGAGQFLEVAGEVAGAIFEFVGAFL